MGYAIVMFGVLLVMSLVVVTAYNYGIAKDSEVAPLKAENIYAEREAGKAQTDMVIVTTKVNGTMRYTSATSGTDSDPLNLTLTVKNNGSIVLSPLKYSILLNNTWVWINSTSNTSTPPMLDSMTSSINLKQKPLSLLLSAENGVKIIVPTAPILRYIDPDPAGCYYNVTIGWDPSIGNMWPITQYAAYYTDTDNIHKTDNVSRILTVGANTTMFIGDLYRKPGGGHTCEEEPGEPHAWVWIVAYDTHGNEGVPSNTCYTSGSSNVTCN